MKTKLTFLMLTLVCLAGFPALAYDDGDWQFWTAAKMEGKLSDSWRVDLGEEFRFGDGMGELYYHHTEVGLTWKTLNWLSLGIDYRHIYQLKSGNWIKENRMHFNITTDWRVKRMTFGNRCRLEYRDPEDTGTFWRLRDKITLSAPVPSGRISVTPYAANEFFWDFKQDEYNTNRMYLGCKSVFYRRLQGEIYYMRQSTKKNDAWIGSHAMGVNLTLKF